MRLNRLGLVFAGLSVAMIALVALFVALAPGEMLVLERDLIATATAQHAPAGCEAQSVSQPQPGQAQALAEAVAEAEMVGVVTVEAEAVGTGCVDADGSVTGFQVERTDVAFGLEAAGDAPGAGETVAGLLAVLGGHAWPEDAPAGEVRFDFGGGGESLVVGVERALGARGGGRRGPELMGALRA